MEALTLKPERLAALEEFAKRHGQSPADALDEAVAAYLESDSADFDNATAAIARGHEDILAGRTRPGRTVFEELRRQHGLPR